MGSAMGHTRIHDAPCAARLEAEDDLSGRRPARVQRHPSAFPGVGRIGRVDPRRDVHARERLADQSDLPGEVGRRTHVLERTAATGAEVGAWGRDTVFTRAEDLDDLPALARETGDDLFACERERDRRTCGRDPIALRPKASDLIDARRRVGG